MLRQKSLGAFYPVIGRKFLHILRIKTQLHANSWKRCVSAYAEKRDSANTAQTTHEANDPGRYASIVKGKRA